MLKIPYTGNRVRFINNLTDLPTPVGNIITLEANTSYFFAGAINLNGNRLVAPNNVLIGGFSPNVCSIISNIPAGESLITCAGNIQIVGLTLSVNSSTANIFNLNGISVPAARCIMREIIATGSGLGTIQNYGTILAAFSVFSDLKSSLVVDGTCGIVIFDTCQFVNITPGATSMTYPSTFSSSIRVRILSCGFSTVVGATSINVDPAVTINPDNLVIDSVIFSGGSVTHVVGITEANSIAFFRDNTGIKNSFSAIHFYMHGNLTATTVASTAVWYKISGTTTLNAVNTQRFTMPTNNRATYTGIATRKFRVSAVTTLQDGNSVKLAIAIHKNGVIVADSEMAATTPGTGEPVNVSTFTILELSTNDYIEVFLRNYTSATNVTATDLILSLQEI